VTEKEVADVLEAVQRLLVELGRVKIAVSGGVDSMTLALIAGRHPSCEAAMVHAVSPAVPAAATRRVADVAASEGWRLGLVNAGEFQDEAYRANPYRRCYHCKDNLYRTLSQLGPGAVLSGTNRDDLLDFRPGLEAAQRFGVRHPFVECGVDKAGIRRLCRHLGYPDLAALPASPCLSSRVETGLRIEPPVLGFVDQVERLLRVGLGSAIVRCRVRRQGITIQLDPASLQALAPADAAHWRQCIRNLGEPLGLDSEIRFEPYRMGSAFVPGP
jgi:uncharacterized protein